MRFVRSAISTARLSQASNCAQRRFSLRVRLSALPEEVQDAVRVEGTSEGIPQRRGQQQQQQQQQHNVLLDVLLHHIQLPTLPKIFPIRGKPPSTSIDHPRRAATTTTSTTAPRTATATHSGTAPNPGPRDLHLQVVSNGALFMVGIFQTLFARPRIRTEDFAPVQVRPLRHLLPHEAGVRGAQRSTPQQH